MYAICIPPNAWGASGLDPNSAMVDRRSRQTMIFMRELVQFIVRGKTNMVTLTQVMVMCSL